MLRRTRRARARSFVLWMCRPCGPMQRGLWPALRGQSQCRCAPRKVLPNGSGTAILPHRSVKRPHAPASAGQAAPPYRQAPADSAAWCADRARYLPRPARLPVDSNAPRRHLPRHHVQYSPAETRGPDHKRDPACPHLRASRPLLAPSSRQPRPRHASNSALDRLRCVGASLPHQAGNLRLRLRHRQLSARPRWQPVRKRRTQCRRFPHLQGLWRSMSI